MNLDWSWVLGALQFVGGGAIVSLIVTWVTKARRLKYVVTVVPAKEAGGTYLTGERGFEITTTSPVPERDNLIHMLIQPKYTSVVAKIISRNAATFAIEGAEIAVLDEETGLVVWYAPDYILRDGQRIQATPQNLRKVVSESDRSLTYLFELFGRPRLLYLETVDDRNDRRGCALHKHWRAVRRKACKDSARAPFAVHLHRGMELKGRVDSCFEPMYGRWQAMADTDDETNDRNDDGLTPS